MQYVTEPVTFSKELKNAAVVVITSRIIILSAVGMMIVNKLFLIGTRAKMRPEGTCQAVAANGQAQKPSRLGSGQFF